MAVDSIDARTRAVDKMKAEPGKEMAAYQAAENQLLAIQAEQKQNLAMARAQSSATVQQNNTIAQAAEVAAAGGEAAQVQQVPVNAATQGVLGKYGMGPTVSKTTTRQNQTVTKQNITINNYNTTTNNTTNNVPNTGPVQGRPVVVNRDDTGRFKVWVNNVLARQNEQAAIRDKEFAKRESALSRSANRMTRKLESISSNLSEKLDPRRMNTSTTSAFKTVMTMMGIGLIAKNWPAIVKALVGVEEKVTNFLDYIGITGRSDRAKSKKDSRLVDDIKYILSGKRGTGSDVSLGSIFMEFFKGNEENPGIIDLIKGELKLWAEQRSNALKSIKFPDVSVWKPGEAIQALVGYLGNALQIIIGGPNAAVAVAAKTGRKESKSDFFRSYGQGGNAAMKNSAGEIIGADGKEHKTTLNDAVLDRTRTLVRSDLNSSGELSDNLAASIRQSSYTADDITGQNGHGKLNILGILEGMKNIEKSINKFDHTAVDPSLLEALEKIGVDVSDIGKNTKEFRYVSVERTEKEKELDGNSRATHKLKLVEVGDDNYPEDKYPTVTEAEGPWSFIGKGKIPGLNDKGTISYPILTKEDMSKIKSALSTITGNEKISFDADDIQSTKAIGEYLKTKSDREVHDTYKRSIEHAAEALEQQADYKRKSKELWEASTMKSAADRTNEVVIEPLKEKSREAMELINSAKIDKTKSFGTRVKRGEPEGDSEGDEGITGSMPLVETESDGSIISNGKTFNVDAAVEEIIKNSSIVSKNIEKNGDILFRKGQTKDYKKSTGMCYRHVAQAIDVGLGNDTTLFTAISSRPGFSGTKYAKDAGSKLESLGFRKINKASGTKKGDIVVFQPTDPSKAGHIAMNVGGRWVSDFIQNTFTGNKNPKAYRDYALYRFGGDQSSEDAKVVPDRISQPSGNSITTDPSLELATTTTIPQSQQPISPAVQKLNIALNNVSTPNNVAAVQTSSPNQESLVDVAAVANATGGFGEVVKGAFGNELANKLDQIIALQTQGNNINMMTAQASAANVDATYSTGQATAAAAASGNKRGPGQEPGWTS